MAALVTGAAALAAPAQASPLQEDAFVARMGELNIGANHGHIQDNAVEDRKVLGLGYQICNSLHGGIAPLDEMRNLMVNSMTRSGMGQGAQLDRTQIEGLVGAAQQFLCPDTL